MSTGLFGGISKAKPNNGGVYFLPGNYLLEVQAVKTGKTREGKKPFFVVEFTIIESDNPERRPKTSVSWMVMMDQYEETALGNIKGFVSALYGVDHTEVDEVAVEKLVSAENPGAGLRVFGSATNIKTKKNTDFTKVVFRHYEGA